MTRLEAGLLFVALFEAGALLGLAWWLRRRRRRPLDNVGEQITWAMNYIQDRYGKAPPTPWFYGQPGSYGDKASVGEGLRRGAADALGVRLPAPPHLEEGTEVELVRHLEGGWQDGRRYRVERAIGDQVRLKAIDVAPPPPTHPPHPPSDWPLHPFAPDG